MNPTIASLICALGIVGLLYLDRERASRSSQALWIPGLWIAAVGSRPVSTWFGFQPGADVQLEGSPLDAAFFALLLAMAIIVLIRRGARTQTLLLANRALLAYMIYALVSVAWSHYPDVSLKRWVKAIGDLAIVLVIVTDPEPLAAIRRTVSRVGFLLLPVSVLFIKYYGELGRGYTADGVAMNVGVTTNKNSLGLMVLVVSLVTLWNLRFLLVQKDEPDRGRRLVAQGILLAFGITLLGMAGSATCIASFALGSVIMIASAMAVVIKRPVLVHVQFLLIILVAGLTFFLGGSDGVIGALGRDASMSGRTDIWPAVLNAAQNPLLGAGYEGFWFGPNVEIFRQQLLEAGWYPPLVAILNEAHNGYIEVYLNLGWIGICLIAMILASAYFGAYRAFQTDPEVGSLAFAFIAVSLVYSITEAGFRMLTPAWIFLLLVMMTATGVTTGMFVNKSASLPDGAGSPSPRTRVRGPTPAQPTVRERADPGRAGRPGHSKVFGNRTRRRGRVK